MTSPFLLASVAHWFFGGVLLITSVFLVLLVLVQRGRGGGLTGALGGMGGQSAFGTKAGDLFTRVTMGVAAFWIVMCVMSVKVLTSSAQGPFGSAPRGATSNVDRDKDGADGKGDKGDKGDAEGKDDGKSDSKGGASAPSDSKSGDAGGAGAGGSVSEGGGDASAPPAAEGGGDSKPTPESKP